MVIFAFVFGQSVFAESSGNEEMYLYTVFDGGAKIIDVDSTSTFIGEQKIPEQIGGYPVTAIGDNAFKNCNELTGITVPNSVNAIGYGAFYGCSKLEKISLPFVGNVRDNPKYNSGKSCFSYIFGDAVPSSTTKVIITDSVPIPKYAFYKCENLTSVILKGAVTSIGERAFSDCTNLRGITIPDSVTYIANQAFWNCTGLTDITVPNSVTYIGNGAFGDCSKLENVSIPFVGNSRNTTSGTKDCSCLTAIFDTRERDHYGMPYGHNTNVKNVVITDSTTIPAYAFSNCSKLTSISIPDSVTAIGSYAFSYCKSLERLYITDLAAWCNIEFASGDANPMTYAKTLYINNEVTTDIVIPDSVTSIRNYTFRGCSNLTSIIIPDTVTTIGDNAFGGCRGLTSISIPDTVTTIGNEAFYNCSGLTSISISDTVTTIGDSAFAYCSGLTSISIPDAVTTIGNDTFSKCSNLTSIVIPDAVTTIGEGAFGYCSSLTSIVIPDSVTAIGKYAFAECSRLKNVYYTATSNEWEKINIASWYNNYLKEAKITYNCKVYNFKTNGGSAVASIATNNGIQKSPVTEYEGKYFLGWYNNEELMGEPVTFPYNGDKTTLYAKWGEKSDCYVLKMLTPSGGTIVHNGEGENGEISDLRVANSFDSITIDVEVSIGAEWELYYTRTASTPISKTVNLTAGKMTTRYIRVKSEDGIHEKTYKITIYRQSKSAVPTISASRGIVTMTMEADGKIYYTTDKSDPSEINGSVYTKPFAVEPGTVIKAAAKADDKDELSDIVIYTVEDDETVTVSQISAEKNGGKYEYEFYVESPKSFNGIFVVVGYSNDGRLKEITRTALNENASEYLVSDNIKINSETSYYKYFLWDEANFIPLCEAQEIIFDN